MEIVIITVCGLLVILAMLHLALKNRAVYPHVFEFKDGHRTLKISTANLARDEAGVRELVAYFYSQSPRPRDKPAA